MSANETETYRCNCQLAPGEELVIIGGQVFKKIRPKQAIKMIRKMVEKYDHTDMVYRAVDFLSEVRELLDRVR